MSVGVVLSNWAKIARGGSEGLTDVLRRCPRIGAEQEGGCASDVWGCHRGAAEIGVAALARIAERVYQGDLAADEIAFEVVPILLREADGRNVGRVAGAERCVEFLVSDVIVNDDADGFGILGVLDFLVERICSPRDEYDLAFPRIVRG